jgi:copper(I)-binding protein
MIGQQTRCPQYLPKRKFFNSRGNTMNHSIRRYRLAPWLAGVVLAICAGGAMAAPSVNVQHARIRLLPGDLPLAGYCDVKNTGSAKVTLTGASSPAFGGVMMHLSMHKNGEASMKMVDKIDIAPGKTLRFAPGGYHLMLMNRKHSLKVGDVVPITLHFSEGMDLEKKFRVGGANTQ